MRAITFGGKFIGGTFPEEGGAIFLRGNYPGGNHPGGNYPEGNYPGGNYLWGQFSSGAICPGIFLSKGLNF